MFAQQIYPDWIVSTIVARPPEVIRVYASGKAVALHHQYWLKIGLPKVLTEYAAHLMFWLMPGT
jgi:hypothetical protein